MSLFNQVLATSFSCFCRNSVTFDNLQNIKSVRMGIGTTAFLRFDNKLYITKLFSAYIS